MSFYPVNRYADVRIMPDPRRVIAKPFLPGEEFLPDGSSRIDVALARILALPESVVADTLRAACAGFGERHPDLDEILETNWEVISRRNHIPGGQSTDRRRLIGAYFTHEYAVEAAALTNPSMVAAPDQSGLGPGEARFVMSLRAIGEGHLSSVELRTGRIGADMAITLDAPSPYAVTGRLSSTDYDKNFFTTKLAELGVLSSVAQRVLDQLDPRFSMADLEQALRTVDPDDSGPAPVKEATHSLYWLASSNYRTRFRPEGDLSERVIFPVGPTEHRGMEDVRLVRFVHDDGEVVYYGTYTAFDGHKILPQLIETTDFCTFRFSTLRGACAQNKGIALFPRKIGGQFVALGRHDNVNNFLMASHDLRAWHETEKIQEPELTWELMQLGNCGSPLETEAGWLVITHGVGPFRQYSLGALLLDLDDPSRVKGHLKEPLLAPVGDEREGYVPNVVYSCGSMIHAGHLVLPYGFGDIGSSIATVPLDDLLGRLNG